MRDRLPLTPGHGTPVAKLFACAHAAGGKRLGVEPGTAVPEMLVPTADQRAMKAIARGGDPLAPEHASVKSFEFQYYRAVVYLQSLMGTREGFDRAAKLFDEMGGRHGKALADAIRAFIMCKTCKGPASGRVRNATGRAASPETVPSAAARKWIRRCSPTSPGRCHASTAKDWARCSRRCRRPARPAAGWGICCFP